MEVFHRAIARFDHLNNEPESFLSFLAVKNKYSAQNLLRAPMEVLKTTKVPEPKVKQTNKFPLHKGFHSIVECMLAAVHAF